MENNTFKDGAAVLQALFKNEQGQTISFRGLEEQVCSSAIFSSDVKVEMEVTNHTSGSSAITTRNITNYPWEQYYFSGSLVAVHCSGEYIAYAIKAPQKSTGMVRIINRKTGGRGLVKNIRGMVRDLSFMYLHSRVILAFTDQYGTLTVIEVTPETEDSLSTETLLEVSSDDDSPSDMHRVIFCPYIPDEQGSGDEGDDPAFLLVLTHGKSAEIWKLNVVLKDIDSVQVSRKEVHQGYQLIEQHNAAITAASFSPDGTALATASLDGNVKFFQVYLADEEKCPRCLHQWNPHEGKPLSALFFLDNHKRHSPEDQFWKYAVTGAANNSELKVWSCESWKCHQTLRFVHSQRDPPVGSGFAFKAAIDPSASFLVLSDIHRRVMYVIAMSQEGSTSNENSLISNIARGTSNNKNAINNAGGTRMVSVTELPVQYPALSLAITDAGWKHYKRWKHDHAHDHAHNVHEGDDDDGDSADVVEGVVVRCVLINTKSLQEATIRFQPAVPIHSLPNSNTLDLSVSQDSVVVRDGLTDLSINLNTSGSEIVVSGSTENSGVDSHPPPPPPPDALTSPLSSTPVSSNIASQQSALNTPPATHPPMNLLTPDSFSSPRKPEETDMPEDEAVELIQNNKVVSPVSAQYDSSYKNEYENPTLSLLLQCGSGTLMQNNEGKSNGLNILDTVVSGTSKSPPANALPSPSPSPPPPHNQDPEDAPLATSEVIHPPPVKTGTSTTSSPSLEVQQILHAEDGKTEFADDDDAQEEVELAEDDDIDDLEEEEPEALQQNRTHSQPQPPPITDHQVIAQPKQSPGSQSVSASVVNLLPIISQSPSLKQQPLSLPLKSPLLPDPPLSKIQQSHQNSSQQQSKTSMQPLDVFATLKGLPNQLTCAQLEAEIKKGTSSPESSATSANSAMQQSISSIKKEKSYSPVSNRAEPIMRSVSESKVFHMEHNPTNGPAVTPGITAADVTELRNLMTTCRDQNKETLTQTRHLASKLDKAMQQVNQLAKQVEEIRAAQSHVQLELPHVIASSIRPVVEATLRSEIRSTVLPGVLKNMDPVKTQLSQELHGLTRNAEGQVVDAVTKIVQSRTFVDHLGGSFTNVMAPMVQSSCREAYNKMLLPGINALTQQVFAQVNDSFSRGTREYMKNVESEVQSGRTSVHENVNKATQSINAACTALTTSTKSLQDNVTKLSNQQNILSDTLCEKVKALIREEFSRSLQEHQTSVEARTRASTPAPHPQNPKVAQQQVQALISAGQFNVAFKQALSASDLSLVVFVCERVNPQQVFNMTPCPLSQDVLLSLVNQLSHDLSTFTDLKIKYLEEAVMNLDSSHPVTREHMRQVLQGFQHNLRAHLAVNPTHKKVKMLLMAVNHLAAS